MTPQEKAKELVYSFERIIGINGQISLNEAKQCALIAVDEYIKNLNELSECMIENGGDFAWAYSGYPGCGFFGAPLRESAASPRFPLPAVQDS